MSLQLFVHPRWHPHVCTQLCNSLLGMLGMLCAGSSKGACTLVLPLDSCVTHALIVLMQSHA